MKLYPLLFVLALTSVAVKAEVDVFGIKEEILPNPENEPATVHPVPSERQLKWNETEFYAFFHFGMNTFTDKEWGYGDEDETLYAPKGKPNPRQWLEVAKAAGMKGGIAVAKHHDGFCLWPTATTSHSIASCGNENGQVNIPQEFADAAREMNMKYGFYVSPWDRNSAYYGDGTDRYTREVFLRQCDELSRFGDDQFEMWFDGANGGDGYYGGANTTRKIDASVYYDIPNLRDSIHTMMPDCVMWGMGGEARWIGNEAGWAGETNWSYGNGTSGDENAIRWFPGESDAKCTRFGWFWHKNQKMNDVNTLWKMYMETVGRNATLILNIPPDQYGLIPKNYADSLIALGDLIQSRLSNDLAGNAVVTATDVRKPGVTRTYDAYNLIDGNKDTYWATNDGVIDSYVTFTFPEITNVHYVSLMEYIKKGQRIKDFDIEITTDGDTWTEIPYDATTTVGYKRIVPLNGSTIEHGDGFDIKGLRVHFKEAKASPALHTISIF